MGQFYLAAFGWEASARTFWDSEKSSTSFRNKKEDLVGLHDTLLCPHHLVVALLTLG